MQLYNSSNMTGSVYDKGNRFLLSKKLGRWILFLLVLAIIECDRARNMSSQRDQTDYKLTFKTRQSKTQLKPQLCGTPFTAFVQLFPKLRTLLQPS